MQRKSEWEVLDEDAMRYHLQQWDITKESTKSFYSFIKDKISESRIVADIGCGAGAATYFLQKMP